MSAIIARTELVLICVMGVGFLLIAQQVVFGLYQAGLLIVVASTLLHIVVGNLPRTATPARTAMWTVAILLIVAAVFYAGVLLVPLLAQLGR